MTDPVKLNVVPAQLDFGCPPPYEVFPFAPPLRPPFPPFVQYEKLLSDEQCDDLVRTGMSLPLHHGKVGTGESRTDLNYRTVRMRGLAQKYDRLGWFHERTREAVILTNDEHFFFDLYGLLEPFQFLCYEAVAAGASEPAGHYHWHQDFGAGSAAWRKLSFVVNLTDPAEYDGCRLYLFTDKQVSPDYWGKGSAILFPSWTPHMVSPITRGTRHAIVGWFGGPQFR